MASDGDAAQWRMDDIRQEPLVVEAQHDTRDTCFTVTVSGVLAEFPDAATSHQPIVAADKALNDAERAGRERDFRAG